MAETRDLILVLEVDPLARDVILERLNVDRAIIRTSDYAKTFSNKYPRNLFFVRLECFFDKPAKSINQIHFALKGADGDLRAEKTGADGCDFVIGVVI